MDNNEQDKPLDSPAPNLSNAKLVDINSVDEFGAMVGQWHRNLMQRLYNLRQIPHGTEITITDPDGTVTSVKLKGDGMKGFHAALDTAISEIAQLPFVATIEQDASDEEGAANDDAAPGN